MNLVVYYLHETSQDADKILQSSNTTSKDTTQPSVYVPEAIAATAMNVRGCYRLIYLCWQEHTRTQYLQDLYSPVKLDWNQTTKLSTAQPWV